MRPMRSALPLALAALLALALPAAAQTTIRTGRSASSPRKAPAA